MKELYQQNIEPEKETKDEYQKERNTLQGSENFRIERPNGESSEDHLKIFLKKVILKHLLVPQGRYKASLRC